MLSRAAAPSQAWRTATIVVAALALFPVIGSLASAEFNWGAGDFVLWWAMVGALAGALFLIPRLVRTRAAMALGISATVLAFLLVWAELAVGIFD
jgi:hypothetical protein